VESERPASKRRACAPRALFASRLRNEERKSEPSFSGMKFLPFLPRYVELGWRLLYHHCWRGASVQRDRRWLFTLAVWWQRHWAARAAAGRVRPRLVLRTRAQLHGGSASAIKLVREASCPIQWRPLISLAERTAARPCTARWQVS